MTWDGKPAIRLSMELKEPWIRPQYEATGKALAIWLPDDWISAMTRSERLHALAALCLKDQEFGFTRDDVELLLLFARGDPQEHIRHECGDLAARIAALLPPEEVVRFENADDALAWLSENDDPG